MSIQTPFNTIERIRRRAKVIARAQNIQHTKALDKAALEMEFRCFEHAKNVIQSGSQIAMPAYFVTLSAYWRDYELGISGRETLRISLKKPWTELIRKPQLDNCHSLGGFDFAEGSINPDHLGHWKNMSASAARRRVCAAARTFAFMEATGLRPSSAIRKAMPADFFTHGVRIPGMDHASVWFDPRNRRYLIANEPYEAAAESRRLKGNQEQEQWCQKYGYDTIKSPWPGMYGPDSGTHLYLFSRKDKGLVLEPVVTALAQMAAPLVESDWAGESTQNTFPPRKRSLILAEE